MLIKSYIGKILNGVKPLKDYIISASVFIVLAYSCYFVFSENIISKLGEEDELFEYLTAIFFLFTSIFFIVIFCLKKKIIYLFFFMIFFVGMGEEISWGQRILNFNTPEYFENNNVQDEFNFHNLLFFNAMDFEGSLKTGFSKLLSVNFLYKLFWLFYCVLLPVIYPFSHFVRVIVKKIDLPVPPFSLGILFMINWLIFRVTLSFLLPLNRSLQYYDTSTEICECCSAFLFMILSLYFLQGIREARKQIL